MTRADAVQRQLWFARPNNATTQLDLTANHHHIGSGLGHAHAKPKSGNHDAPGER